MIRGDVAWRAVEPLDLRAGIDIALARVIKVFGAAHPHHAYPFANRRANRIKVLVHDGIGIWLAARRLNQGCFVNVSGRSQFDIKAQSPWPSEGFGAKKQHTESRRGNAWVPVQKNCCMTA